MLGEFIHPVSSDAHTEWPAWVWCPACESLQGPFTAGSCRNHAWLSQQLSFCFILFYPPWTERLGVLGHKRCIRSWVPFDSPLGGHLLLGPDSTATSGLPRRSSLLDSISQSKSHMPQLSIM